MWTGEEIRRRRQARGLTQQQLADELGASRRAVVSWEAGQSPQGRFFVQLGHILGDPAGAPVGDDDLLLRDADFGQTLAHLLALYYRADGGPAGPPTEP